MTEPDWRTYRQLEAVDRNLWWRLPAGVQQNLFDGAMDELERLQNQMEHVRMALAGIYRAVGTLEPANELDDLVTLAAITLLASEALTDTDPEKHE